MTKQAPVKGTDGQFNVNKLHSVLTYSSKEIAREKKKVGMVQQAVHSEIRLQNAIRQMILPIFPFGQG